LQQSQKGEGANHTRKRLPVRLVYVEVFTRIDWAFYGEKQLQGWSSKKKEALMRGDSNAWGNLSACQNVSHHRFRSFAMLAIWHMEPRISVEPMLYAPFRWIAPWEIEA